MNRSHNEVAVVTGGSAGLGLALVAALAGSGWSVITDARDAGRLHTALPSSSRITSLAGDVRDPDHQDAIAAAVARHGRLDLVVHNASELGPMLPLAEATANHLSTVLETNLIAPLTLSQRLLPYLIASRGTLVGISSDAAVEHYPTWGTYAASKAALDHLILTLGEENGIRAFALDPGDMRTAMHQAAFPGEDISDRPLPESVVPHLLALFASDTASGRYRAADLSLEGATR
ncbi:NAD(P)-dependent dehydrogenase (short-subunit alcohol dehydrogenase family) [Nocardioides albertanoniae]|uniref:NAD(P)-dependent dehydrogenase (Short-subunit alcohol dehydrogenase family) n=1 Tax=Nocardioides albertanoniae TaxID=1175486 RepID=A0A543A843_9ACTN|nr:SDR family NAD(P)-dependent oxidoreductase [Nocardioides albertanoniae]TQL68656.1 NAD(P)-dependent dehydrogenase (short-subunit alcohol dehydrogenase family) [Nocardioides albertanoniae]